MGADAARLPLNECATPATCRCAYRKYTDRRDGPRREEEETGMRRGITQPDRRVRRGQSNWRAQRAWDRRGFGRTCLNCDAIGAGEDRRAFPAI